MKRIWTIYWVVARCKLQGGQSVKAWAQIEDRVIMFAVGYWLKGVAWFLDLAVKPDEYIMELAALQIHSDKATFSDNFPIMCDPQSLSASRELSTQESGRHIRDTVVYTPSYLLPCDVDMPPRRKRKLSSAEEETKMKKSRSRYVRNSTTLLSLAWANSPDFWHFKANMIS